MNEEKKYDEGEIELFEQLLQVSKNGYSVYDTIVDWIDEEAFEEFDSSLEDNKEKISKLFSIEDRRKILDHVIKNNNNFFSEKFNTIYLKLINLYYRRKRIMVEDTDLYYITEKFEPTEYSKNTIVNETQELINEKFLKDKVFNYFYTCAAPYEILNQYIGVRLYAKEVALSQANGDEEKDEINNVIDAINEMLEIYDADPEYLENMIFDNRKEKIASLISKINFVSFAVMYCSVFGNKFTEEERKIISDELSEEEIISLNATNHTKK